MNQHQSPSGRAGSSTESGGGGISTKSHEAAENFERTVVEQAERARERADSARSQAAERIRRFSTQLKDMSESLRSEDEMAARLAEGVSRRVEDVARYVTDTDARALISDTEKLARREPALFFGGAFLLGLAAGRFIRSSRPATDTSQAGPASWEMEPPRRAREGWEPDLVRSPSVPRPSPSPDPSTSSTTSGSSAQRFRENFDATFDRDPSARQAETSPEKQTQAGLGSAPASTGSSRERNNGIAGNGGMPAGKGTPP